MYRPCVKHSTGASNLTPDDSYLLSANDHLLLLAANASHLTRMPWKAAQQVCDCVCVYVTHRISGHVSASRRRHVNSSG
jgi:hypothetical protein